MEVPHVIIFLGVLIFFSHIFNELFSRTKVPNVLLLLLIGIIIGPITGLVDQKFMGQFGPVFTTGVLILILFESGTGLRFGLIGKAIGPALILTLINFIATVVIATVLITALTELSWLNSMFVGAIIGGTSSAVVIPMVRQLRMREKSETVLFLESALSDVLCLVVGLALLNGLEMGAISFGEVVSKMWKSFLFAALIGAAGGFVWALVLNPIRSVKNSMFTSLAIVFVFYGIVESIGYNGGIATLMFGIILGNVNSLNNTKFIKRFYPEMLTDLTSGEKNFFGELVFIAQTYFFVYVGISIQFGSPWIYVVGLILVGLIILFRPLSIRLISKKDVTFKELAIMSVMTPKGLVPAVLASIPLMMGIEGGKIIQDLGYSVVLFSILICSILVIILGKDPLFFKRMVKKKKERPFREPFGGDWPLVPSYDDEEEKDNDEGNNSPSGK